MRLKKQPLKRFLSLASFATACFIPIIPALQPFHFSLLPLGLLALLSSYQMADLLWLLIIIGLSLLGSLMAYAIYGFPTSISALWAAAPLTILLLTYITASRVQFSRKQLLRFTTVVGWALAAFILLQLLFPGSRLAGAYIVSRSWGQVWERFVIVVAPIGNPNNMALVLAMVILFLQYLAYGCATKKTQGLRLRVFESGTQALLLGLLLLLMAVGVFFAYARTVLAALGIAEIIFVIACTRNFMRKTSLIAIISILGILFWAILSWVSTDFGRQSTYYATLLDPARAYSVLVRFSTWLNVLSLLWDNPYLFSTGVGWYEGALYELQENTVIDSTYLYLLLSHGIPVTVFLLAGALTLAFRYRPLIPIMILLSIASITLAFMSDFRLNIIIGSIIGWIVGLENRESAALSQSIGLAGPNE